MKQLSNLKHPMDPGYSFRGFYIPAYMLDALERYIHQGQPPGDFLSAVISNDLTKAVARADDHNQVNLPAYIAYLHNEAPGVCWGSPEKMKTWIEAKKLKAA